MISLYPLVKNETIKMVKKRRFLVIILIIVVMMPIFTYAQLKIAESSRERYGTADWRVITQNQIMDNKNRMSDFRVPDDLKQTLDMENARLQYGLDHNIDPQTPNGVTFTRDFFRNAIALLLPLLVVILTSDIVSSEQSSGTIKILLTRPVRRWKILMSKLIAQTLFISLILLITGLLGYAVSGLVFGYDGWTMPVITGIQVSGTELSAAGAHTVEQWLFLLMEIGLCWFSCFVVGCLSLMVSVLVRSTAAGMGIMMATLIAGAILSIAVSTWDGAKYLYMVNLQTVTFLSGALPSSSGPPTVSGLTLPFSLAVLAAWGAAALLISFGVFTKRDILS